MLIIQDVTFSICVAQQLIRQFHTVWNEVSFSKRRKQRIIKQCKQSKIGLKKVTWENQYHVRGVEERRKVYTRRRHKKTIWKNSKCCCWWWCWAINHYFSFLTLVFTCDWAGCKSDRFHMQQCFRVKQQKLKAVKKLKVFHWCGLYLLRGSSGMSGWISLAQFTLEMEKMTQMKQNSKSDFGINNNEEHEKFKQNMNEGGSWLGWLIHSSVNFCLIIIMNLSQRATVAILETDIHLKPGKR